MASCEKQAQLDVGRLILELLCQCGDDCFVRLRLCEAHFVVRKVLVEDELVVGPKVVNTHELERFTDLVFIILDLH